MASDIAAIDPAGVDSTRRSALVAWSVAFALGLAIVGAGLSAAKPLPVLGWAAAFLVLAVGCDVRSHRLPNLLTLPALLGALLVSPWLGGTSGPLEAATGAALGFGLLVGPYALGGVGGGDVKALMALGAWIGPAAALGSAGFALIVAGCFGLVLLALRRELADFARRWRRILVATVLLRRFEYEPAASGSAAASGIPFAAALAIGLSIQWLGGSLW